MSDQPEMTPTTTAASKTSPCRCQVDPRGYPHLRTTVCDERAEAQRIRTAEIKAASRRFIAARKAQDAAREADRRKRYGRPTW